MKSFKKIIFTNLLIFFSIITIILVVDFSITNLKGYRGFAKFLESNNDAGYINKPKFSGIFGGYLDEFSNRVTIGEFGERLSLKNEKCEYKYNIIFLGDSSTASFEIERKNTFISKLNNEQCKILGMNFGVRGHNSHNVLGNYIFLKNRVKHKAIVYIFHSNDITDNLNIDRYNNLYEFFGNVQDGQYKKPKNKILKKYYYKFGVYFSDNFYLATKVFKFIRYELYIKKRLEFGTKYKNNELKKEEIDKFLSIMNMLSDITSRNNVKLYLAGYPCINSSNCKSIKVEKILLKEKKFNTLPLASKFNQKFSSGEINKKLMRFKKDGHGTIYANEKISKEFVNFFSEL